MPSVLNTNTKFPMEIFSLCPSQGKMLGFFATKWASPEFKTAALMFMSFKARFL